MSWSEDVISGMLYLRGRGFDFDRAWSEVLGEYPPSRRELGLTYAGEETLAGDVQLRRALKWFEVVCRRAWFDAPQPDGSASLLGRLGPLEDAMRVSRARTPAHPPRGKSQRRIPA